METCKIINQDKYNYKTLIPCNLYGPYDNFNQKVICQSAIKKIYVAKKKQ